MRVQDPTALVSGLGQRPRFEAAVDTAWMGTARSRKHVSTIRAIRRKTLWPEKGPGTVSGGSATDKDGGISGQIVLAEPLPLGVPMEAVSSVATVAPAAATAKARAVAAVVHVAVPMCGSPGARHATSPAAGHESAG